MKKKKIVSVWPRHVCFKFVWLTDAKNVNCTKDIRSTGSQLCKAINVFMNVQEVHLGNNMSI